MKYLTMTGFTVRTGSDRWTLGYEGENNSRTLQIKTTDDLTDFATVNLLIDTLDCGAMTVTTVGNFKVLSMMLTAGMLGEAGMKTCQLLMMDSEGAVIKKTNQFQMVVNTSNTVDGMAPDSPTAIIITDYIDDAINERVSDEFIEEKINDWLDDHPEATTTVQNGAITENKLHSDVKNKYVTRQYSGTAPNTQDFFLEKLNNDTLLLEPINLQTIRDCRLLGFKFRDGNKNHVFVERCYFSGESETPVFDFNSENWVGSVKVLGCESYFRPNFIVANSKDMTDVYYQLCTIEGAKQFATMSQNAIIRFDSCYIGDQLPNESADAPYIEMSNNAKLIITNSQFGSDSKGGQPFIKCGNQNQVIIKDSNLIMTNQAEPYANRYLNYGGVPFSGEIGCDFILDNVTWNVIPNRLNYNHNSVPFECRKDKWMPKTHTPVKNYMKNPFFLDASAVPNEWIDVTEDSTSPFYEYYNPYGGHIYSCGNTTQSFKFNWEIPDNLIGRTFYFVLFINAQISSSASPYFNNPSFENCVIDATFNQTGANNMVAPNSLENPSIYTPFMNMRRLTCNATTGAVAIGRNSVTTYISGMALVLDEDINKFPIYENLY